MWVKETLMPNLYSSEWYNGQPIQTWREALQTKDRATIRLGIARLRQMRIKDGQFPRDNSVVLSFASTVLHVKPLGTLGNK